MCDEVTDCVHVACIVWISDDSKMEENELDKFEQDGIQHYLNKKKYDEEKHIHTIDSIMQRYVYVYKYVIQCRNGYNFCIYYQHQGRLYKEK